MRPTRLISIVATAVALAACGSPTSSAPSDESKPASATALNGQVLPQAERRFLAVDVTDSTDARSADVVSDLRSEIASAYLATGGAGSYLTVADFAGGPGDAQSIDDFELCRGGRRRCADEVAQAERVEAMSSRVMDMLSDPPSVGGSDPVGFLFHALSQVRQGFEENPTSVVIWSDFVSRSDALLLDGSTDISSPEARAAVIDSLVAKGLDFSTIDLDGVAIEVRLVPTDISAQSSVYAEFVRSLAAELLARTGATVNVSLFTATGP